MNHLIPEYTAGILTGKVKTLDQYAKLCARELQACKHMEKLPLNAEYVDREPNEDYLNDVQKYKDEIQRIENANEKDLVINEEQFRKDKIASYEQEKVDSLENAEKLTKIMSLVQEWNPGELYLGLKAFMLGQIDACMAVYGNPELHDKMIDRWTNMPPIKRRGFKKRAVNSLTETLKQLETLADQDQVICDHSNEWHAGLIDELKNK